jgi:holo-[acyl-carrier protein] synthase
MDILGLGTQVLECARVRALLEKHGETFLKQVYTDREVRFCNGKRAATEQFTAIWAAKEAVFRALGTTWKKGTNWADIEVVCEGAGAPQVVVGGPTGELLAARGVNQVMVTLAHCRAFATATAVALRVPAPRAPEDTAIDD